MRRQLGKRYWMLGAACALWACDDGSRAPSFDFDPTLVEDAGIGGPPRQPPVGGGTGRADAGKPDAAAPDAAAPDAASGAPDAAPSVDAAAGPEQGGLADAERLLIADGLQQRLYAYDVSARTLLDSFEIGAPARVYAGPSGRYGYALPSEGGQVHIVDMGFVEQDNTQGSRRRLAPVALLDASLRGLAPSTLLARADWVGVSFDGEGKAVILREGALPQLETEALTLSGGAQHGFALPFGDGFLATRVEGGQLTLARYDQDGSLDSDASFDCADPEGVVLAGGEVAVGCAAGVLRLSVQGAARLIPYPDATGAPAARVHRLVGHASGALVLTVLGDQFCTVGASELTCQALAQPAIDYGFDAAGKRALVLSSDGILRLFDADGLSPRGMLRVTSAVIASDELMQPQLASGRRFTYVSDPAANSVHLVDPASLSLAGRIDLPGAPAKLAVFGFR